MEEDAIGVGRFVRVIFVEELIVRVMSVEEVA